MSKHNFIYPRVAFLILLSWCAAPVLLGGIEKYQWPRLLRVGIIFGTAFTSTIMAGAWTSFGPGDLLMRLPLSLLWAALMGFSLDVAILALVGPLYFGQYALLTSALWLVALVPFWTVALIFGLKLWYQRTAHESHNPKHRQFGIGQLMTFTAFIAVVLGVGRWLLEILPETMTLSSETKFWVFLGFSQIATSVPLVCATMLPRYVPAGVIVSLLLIVGVAAAQMPLATQLVGGFPGNEFGLFTAMNISSVAWIFLFAAVVRFSGYHFGVPVVEQGALEK